MPRIFLIDERIDGAEGDAAARLAAETSAADVVMHFSGATSLVQTLPQVRGAWRQKHQNPATALHIAARGANARLLLGSEGLSTTNANLLVSLRGFAGGRIVLWGCDAGAWAQYGLRVAPPPEPGEEDAPQRSSPANPGHTFLRTLAQTLGLPVFSYLQPQYSRVTWRIVGRHVIVQPSGDFALSDAIE